MSEHFQVCEGALASAVLGFPACELGSVSLVWQVPSCLLIERIQFEEQLPSWVLGSRARITERHAHGPALGVRLVHRAECCCETNCVVCQAETFAVCPLIEISNRPRSKALAQ